MSTARRAVSLPPNLAPIGLSKEEAAAYVGMGVTLFDQLVKDGRMPSAKMVESRLIWYRPQIDAAFMSLPDAVSRKPAPKSSVFAEQAL
jgi:hypothetical protein